jgi:hypothetical protein
VILVLRPADGQPGASVLTQMPCGPSSRDTARVNAVTAPFEVT